MRNSIEQQGSSYGPGMNWSRLLKTACGTLALSASPATATNTQPVSLPSDLVGKGNRQELPATNYRRHLTSAPPPPVYDFKSGSLGQCPLTITKARPPCPPNVDPPEPLQGTLAMCLIVRDQPLDMSEWLGHHRNLGTSAFYIFDHGSSPPMLGSLSDELHQHDIVYRYFDEVDEHVRRPQTLAYNTCIREYGQQHDFMAFIDADEFIILKHRQQSLLDLLSQFTDSGALSINWRIFGSSGHVRRPTGPVMQNYVKCWPEHHNDTHYVKLIGNMKYMRKMTSPHEAAYRDGKFAVDENGESFDGAATPKPNAQIVALYHYAVKSEEDFAQKMKRSASVRVREDVRTGTYFQQVEQRAVETCTDAKDISLKLNRT